MQGAPGRRVGTMDPKHPDPSMHPETREIVLRLALAPHPEGGYYRETWRSPGLVSTPRGDRSALTVIHYLLPAGAFSAFHRVHADEAWHHAGGDALELHVLSPEGEHVVHLLGPSGHPGAAPHAVVSAGAWQAARPLGGRHVLASCTVAPGFHFDDFEMARVEDLLALRPDLEPLLRALCQPGR